MPSLLCSDSLMRDCTDDVRAKLISLHDLDELSVKWFPGEPNNGRTYNCGVLHPGSAFKMYDF